MLKEQIIATAKRLFPRNGIKKVSMSDIAEEAGVSKRTLYELFENKESLLVTILKTEYSNIKACLDELDIETNTALDIILLFNQKIQGKLVCDAFYKDILRYPGALAMQTVYKKAMLCKMISLVKRGVNEGVFLPEINYDMIALMMREFAKMSPPSEAFKMYTNEEVHNTFFLLFIRGICTDNGRKIFKRYVTEGYYDLLLPRLVNRIETIQENI
ncbi:MAG: TetR/AcrR family transcriptional regulator [Tannerella sp.]|jgi:AcrR family transcriptional regulator|nr:TetR/AcrR family transcriptional regulator [Tannerella sp.]